MTGPARVGVAGIAILLVSASGALAAPPPGSSPQDRRDYYAADLIDKVGKRVERDPACRFRAPERGPVDGAPSAELQNSIAALRRPARPGETLDLLRWPRIPSVYRDYARVLTAADGTTFNVFAMHDVSFSKPRPRRCVSELRRGVNRALADRSRAFRRATRRLLSGEISINWAPRRREGVLVENNDGGGTMTDLAGFRQQGLLTFRASMDTPDTTVYDVVPDGVATIDFSFRRGGPTYKTTVAVQDNVVAFHVPLGLRNVPTIGQVWRDPAGNVIRVISGG